MKKFSLFIACLSFLFSKAGDTIIVLNQGWSFQQQGTKKWFKAEVPGTVHTDLLMHKLIPDPFFRDNEHKVQWVETKTWDYRNVFHAGKEVFDNNHVLLHFGGLDTYAEIILNGHRLLKTDNMFRSWTVNIKPYLKKQQNVLLVRFLPVATIAINAKKADTISYPDNERIYVRKAQYHFGWDWGPRLVTAGIWKNVSLLAYNDDRSESVKPRPSWDVKLVREKDEHGESFYFTRNGKPVFIKGANWVPADNFLPRAKKLERYETLIKAAKEANINMLRVWGGGIYEDDVFYELCDKYGIMVWQDFMFAGAMYPAGDSFLRNIEEEVRQQVKRLSKHPCVVIWCGNNEIEEAWFNWGWQKQFQYSTADSSKLWNDYSKVFHQLIPRIIEELDPQTPYWPSSPSLGWGRDSAYKKGDVHYWGVWWGKEPVEKYKEKVGRFNSEYGMQGMPDIKTIKEFTIPGDLDTSGVVMKVHQKHPFGYENIALYINNKFRAPQSFEHLVYVSQLMQADAIRTAIEAHLSNMPFTMGTMFWQWNDCWPVVSWSAVDHYGRKKAMYYQVKRNYHDDIIITSTINNFLLLDIISGNEEDNHSIITATLYNFDGAEKLLFEGKQEGRKMKIPIQAILDSTRFKNQLVLVEKKNSKGELVASAIHLFADPKDLQLQSPKIKATVHEGLIEIKSDKFAYGVALGLPDGVEVDDNYFHLLPVQVKTIRYKSERSKEFIQNNLTITSLIDTY
jgi:beta-mannosidase